MIFFFYKKMLIYNFYFLKNNKNQSENQLHKKITINKINYINKIYN